VPSFVSPLFVTLFFTSHSQISFHADTQFSTTLRCIFQVLGSHFHQGPALHYSEFPWSSKPPNSLFYSPFSSFFLSSHSFFYLIFLQEVLFMQVRSQLQFPRPQKLLCCTWYQYYELLEFSWSWYGLPLPQVLNFEIGTSNIAFFFLEDLWVQFKWVPLIFISILALCRLLIDSRFWMVEYRGVARVGELISIEVCMDIMDLLYEKEEMSVHFRSPKSLAASILVYSLLLISKFQVLWANNLLQSSNILLKVTSYVITVPRQKWEFPLLAWGKKLFDFLSTF